MRTVFPGRLALLLVVALVVAACGGNSGTATPDEFAVLSAELPWIRV